MATYRVEYYYQTKPCFNEIVALSVPEAHLELRKLLEIKRPKWLWSDIYIKRVNEIIEEKEKNIFESDKSIIDFFRGFGK